MRLLTGSILALLMLTVGCESVRPPALVYVAGPTRDLYLIEPDTQTVRPLTGETEQIEADPCLDVSRSQVAYVVAKTVNQQTLYELTILDLETGIDREYTLYTDPIFTPAWSNDGKRLAYTVLRDGRYQIYIFTVNGGQPHQLVGYGSSPSWRQDDRAIFYSSRDTPDATSGELMVHDLSTGVNTSLALRGNGFTNLQRGTSILYTAQPYSRRNEAVWLIDANNRQARLSEPGKDFRDLDPVHINGTTLAAFTRIDLKTNKSAIYVVDRAAEDPVAVPLVEGDPNAYTRGGERLFTR